MRPLSPRVSVEAYALYQKARAPERLIRAFIDELKQVVHPAFSETSDDR